MESIEAQNQQYCLAQERYFKLNDNSENLIRYGSLDLPEEIQLIRRKKLLLAEEMSRLKRDND